jgi:hypothetical protein
VYYGIGWNCLPNEQNCAPYTTHISLVCVKNKNKENTTYGGDINQTQSDHIIVQKLNKILHLRFFSCKPF